MKKRIISALLIFILIIVLSACETFSQELLYGMGYVDLEYMVDLSKETVTISGIGTNKNKSIIIPEEIEGYKVTGIIDYAFEDCTFEQIYLPETLEYIGKGAFYNCTELIEVNGFDKTQVTKISDEAFYNCTSLTYISMPGAITSIGKYAFTSCWELNIDKLPESLTSIGEHAFDNCQSIETVEIPSGVTRVEDYAFFACLSLRDVTLNDGLKSIGYRAFCYCESLTSISIPSTVYTVEMEAFFLCFELSDIEIKDGVKRINMFSFGYSKIDEIYVPESVVFLGPLAFYSTSLQNINIDDNNLEYYSKDGVVYTKNNTSIVLYPNGRKDTSFSIPEGIEIIDVLTFASSNLETLNIPKSVSSIYDRVLTKSINLSIINYEGTIKEWQSIVKGPDWDIESADYTIYCTDGQIAKDGTVTYK